jgi:hypothetical protein
MPVFTCARRMLPRTVCVRFRGGYTAMFHSCTLALRGRSPIVPIAPMSVCTNWGLIQSSGLGANAGYVVLRARLRALSAHEYALALANEYTYSRVSYVPCPLFWSLNSL